MKNSPISLNILSFSILCTYSSNPHDIAQIIKDPYLVLYRNTYFI